MYIVNPNPPANPQYQPPVGGPAYMAYPPAGGPNEPPPAYEQDPENPAQLPYNPNFPK